jgi:hypothetical protein
MHTSTNRLLCMCVHVYTCVDDIYVDKLKKGLNEMLKAHPVNDDKDSQAHPENRKSPRKKGKVEQEKKGKEGGGVSQKLDMGSESEDAQEQEEVEEKCQSEDEEEDEQDSGTPLLAQRDPEPKAMDFEEGAEMEDDQDPFVPPTTRPISRSGSISSVASSSTIGKRKQPPSPPASVPTKKKKPNPMPTKSKSSRKPGKAASSKAGKSSPPPTQAKNTKAQSVSAGTDSPAPPFPHSHAYARPALP